MPSEERIEVAGELKRQKYEKIALDGKINGWSIRIWAIEVGCKGFPAVSVSTFFKDIGYQGARRKNIIDSIGKAAEQASHTLWKCSFHNEDRQPTIIQTQQIRAKRKKRKLQNIEALHKI